MDYQCLMSNDLCKIKIAPSAPTKPLFSHVGKVYLEKAKSLFRKNDYVVFSNMKGTFKPE